MNKEMVLSIIRSLLTLAGTYLIGTNLFGQAIDATVWQEILGAAMTLVGIIWGILDKTASIDAIQSGIRSVIMVGGGLLVAAGKLKADTLTAILGLVASILPIFQSQLSRSTVQQIASGSLSVSADTGKVTKAVSSDPNLEIKQTPPKP